MLNKYYIVVSVGLSAFQAEDFRAFGLRPPPQKNISALDNNP